ncbi:MAG: GNAT family N-acetyltransferase, partial [Pseudomonadota bacterium]
FSIEVPTLPAGHVTLRPVALSDAAAIDHGASNYDVSKMTTSISHPVRDGATEAFLEGVIGPGRSEMVWAMVWADRPLDEILGLISLEKHAEEDAEIGYWIAPENWGQGVASAAVQALVRWNPLECSSYFGSCFVDNPASARVMSKAGFVEMGQGSSFSVARNADVATRQFVCRLQPQTD